MNALGPVFRRLRPGLLALAALVVGSTGLPAQQWVTETRDPKQTQDEDFAKAYKEWTGAPMFGSPLVDHLPKVAGIPMPKDVLGYHIGAPRTLTYYENILKYYRALAAATPRVRVETIGKSDENRELVVVWVSSDDNIKNLQQNRDNLARLADPRGVPDTAVRQLIATTKPHYHFIGGLHSGEFGPPEMLMELVYRLATETSPYISMIRDNVIVSVTPVADADGRDRNVDLFYCNQDTNAAPGGAPAPAGGGAAPAAGRGAGGAGGGGGRAACRTGANTSFTTTTATSTSRRCRCARSRTGTSRRIRRSCTTCTKRSRCSTPTAVDRRRIRISIRFSSPSCRSSRTGSWPR